MSMTSGSAADYLVDRRRLRRRIVFWRLMFVGLLVAAVVGFALSGRNRLANELTPHIARLKIQGLITGDEETLRLLRDIRASRASALILQIDSPGGTTVGSERLFNEIRRVSDAKKPVVAVVGTLAASGAYIAALGSDHIVAESNSLVGSIGVLFAYPNVSRLLDKVGVSYETVKSSPLKAAPSPYEPTSEAARAALASLVGDSYAWFKGLVKDRRGMTDEELAVVSDGRVFTARQGLPLKLVDQLGSEDDAIAWLQTEKGVAKGLPVRDWKSRPSFERLGLFGTAASLADVIGWSSAAGMLRRAGEAVEAPLLDGLVSIWQADQGG